MKSNDKKSIQQFLNNHSHAIDLSHWPIEKIWEQVLLIPVCGEAPESLNTLLTHHHQTSVLVILLVNRPAGHVKEAQWQAENTAFIQHLFCQANETIHVIDKHHLLMDCHHSDVLLLDYNETPFSMQEGVGLARRIAADTALALIEKQIITQPWIFSTDADVVLPAGYFAVADRVSNDASAISMLFEHIGDEQSGLAEQQQYDFKLKYYQQAMTFIGSPYNYIPLGSTLVIQAASYAKVRGFPKRSGGEDFYILNKLSKVGIVEQPKSPVVEIKVRFSDRVPFGTGPAIKKIREQNQQDEAVLYYHPKIFHIIKAWRSELILYYQSEKIPLHDYGLNGYWQLEKTFIKALSQSKTEARWQQFIDEWLDAFRLLKSVHFLREKFESVGFDELVGMESYLDLVCD